MHGDRIDHDIDIISLYSCLRIIAVLRIHYHYADQCSACSRLDHPTLWSSLSLAQGRVSVKHGLITLTFTGFNNGTGRPLTPGGVTLNLCLNLLTGIHSCGRLPRGWGLGVCSLEKGGLSKKERQMAEPRSSLGLASFVFYLLCDWSEGPDRCRECGFFACRKIHDLW